MPSQLHAKQCSVCGETKPHEMFDRTRTGSKTAACHECRREWRKRNKERVRRINGAVPREHIAALAKKKRQIREAKSADYWAMVEESRANRVSEAERYRHKYRTDPSFAEKERTRTRKRKKLVPYWYANHLLGGTGDRQYPKELVLAKQLSKRIDNFIKEKEQHEKHH